MSAYPYTLDRAGNARRFVDKHAGQIRYVPEAEAWIRWDGKRWAWDTGNKVFRMAVETAEELHVLAADPVINNDDAKRLFSWARTSCDDRTVNGVLRIAASDPRVSTPLADLDADPWLLNCPNGTVDLRTGNLTKHEPKHLITKMTRAEYDPHAESPEFGRALEAATEDDEEVIRFLQIAAGYTLAGVPNEELFFYLYGRGGSGKGTFINPLERAMGDYSVKAQVESFLSRRRAGNAASSDVARMAGARMVHTGEPDQGERLASGFIKELTGGDTVTARYMFKKEFEFRPQLTLWFVANDRLYADHRDTGLYRRLIVIPFDHVIPEAERDPKVKAHLEKDPEAQAAVLSWAVQGCLAWQKAGKLHLPPAVRKATEAYQQSMNPLAELIEDRCDLDAEGWVASADLLAAVNATLPPGKHMSAKSLAKHLTAMPGVEAEQERSGARRRGFRGITLLPTDMEIRLGLAPDAGQGAENAA